MWHTATRVLHKKVVATLQPIIETPLFFYQTTRWPSDSPTLHIKTSLLLALIEGPVLKPDNNPEALQLNRYSCLLEIQNAPYRDTKNTGHQKLSFLVCDNGNDRKTPLYQKPARSISEQVTMNSMPDEKGMIASSLYLDGRQIIDKEDPRYIPGSRSSSNKMLCHWELQAKQELGCI